MALTGRLEQSLHKPTAADAMAYEAPLIIFPRRESPLKLLKRALHV